MQNEHLQLTVKDIEATVSQEFCCYGYHNMTSELKELGWIINHKKVYGLMKESRLYSGRIRPEPLIVVSSVSLELLKTTYLDSQNVQFIGVRDTSQ